jgi:hypothetical protein
MVRGVLALGALFLGAFALTQRNPNAGIFLFLAVVCLGLTVVALFARGLQRFGGTMLGRGGRSDRDLLVGGLLLIALLTPWSVAIPTLHWPPTFGWQSPLALGVLAALVLARVRRRRRSGAAAATIAGFGLLTWLAWASAQLLTPTFHTSGFPFLPIDLLGEGWYVGLLAFAISLDGIAADASDAERRARPSEVWPLSIVPGAGLVRLGYPGRGRLWLAAAAFCVFLEQDNAVGPDQFQYFGALRSLPEPRPRGAVLIPLAMGLLVWLASLWETHRKLRLERADDSATRLIEQRDATAL